MKKLMLWVVALFMGGAVMTGAVAPAAYAAEAGDCTCVVRNADGTTETRDGHQVATSILNICDCGGGEAIISIMNLVVRVLTVGVGLVGGLGIVVFGLQYLTAGPNEEQVRKAKRRLLEIVIGFLAYVVLYAVLSWLLPGFRPFA